MARPTLDTEQGGRERRRRFVRFLLWNLLGTAVVSLPLFFFTSSLIALSFVALMVFMSVVLAGYFALLRVE